MGEIEISVVAPSKDRLASVERLLASVRRQSYPQERIEIVVVDDGSEPAYELAGVEVIRHDRPQGAQASRNEALARVRGRWVLMMDDDIELVEQDWLARAAAVLKERAEVAVVFARKLDMPEGTGEVHESSTARAVWYSGELRRSEEPAGPVHYGCSICLLRRTALDQVGGYDGIYGLGRGHSFREESDMQARLRAAGWVLWYEPGITIRHHITPSGGHGAAVGRRLYWIAHNHVVFARRHLRCWPMRAVGFLVDVARYSWVQGRGRHVGAMLRGWFAGWRDALRDRGPGRNEWWQQT